MELSVLDNTFKRVRPIENWNSLVWSERYSANGDFQLTSNRISEVLELLPLKAPDQPPTVVALRDSNVPMVVETHRIEADKKGVPIITTTGRSFETILSRRIAIQMVSKTDGARPAWSIKAMSPSDAVFTVMNRIVKLGIASPLDIIPEITLRDSVTEAWPKGEQEYPIEPKELYEWALETLQLGEHGLRAVLPPRAGGVTTIDIEIYNGTDRTKTVAFDTIQDQFDKTSHLLSDVGHKNVMLTQVASGLYPSRMGPERSGLARRVGYQDLSSEITLPAGQQLTELATNRGLVSLGGLAPIALFSGEISAKQAARYNQDYFLGDKVSLKGEYGLSQVVRIAEFVRTHDRDGERSYPAFQADNAEDA